MNVATLQSAIKPGEIPLEKLEGSSRLTEAQKVGEVARQFEAVLLRQILAAARKSVIKSEFNSESSTSGIYNDMINNQMADDISRNGMFGLARSLQSQLTRQVLKPETAAAEKSLTPVAQAESRKVHHD
ncbi:MAG: rod-binding protein [Opitutaceae bacterium]|nr:rod-binding protein [Verrucomicrobiales bacterium]